MSSSTVPIFGRPQARAGRLWTMLNQLDGLTKRGHVVVLAIAGLTLLLRGYGLFLHPRFVGEDGKFWFAQAYNLGWLHALFLLHTGYLTVAQRIPAGPATLVPLHKAPIVLVLWGALCQVAPVPLLLSGRLRRLGPLGFRLGLAAIYWFLPNSREVFVNDTNCMWHLAVAMMLLVVAEPPAGVAEVIFDLTLVVITGLSGPFSVVLTPIALAAAIARRTRWAFVLTVVIAATAVVQMVCMFTSQARSHAPPGATVCGFVRLIGGDLVLGAMMGSRNWALYTPMVLLVLAMLSGATVYAVCFAEGSLEWRLIIAFGVGMLAASLRSPLVDPGQKGWPILIAMNAIQRYWFLPGLALLWAAAWCWREAKPRPLRWLGAAMLMVLPIGIVRDFRVPGFGGIEFGREARVFEAAPAGTTVRIPIPPDWTMELHKH